MIPDKRGRQHEFVRTWVKLMVDSLDLKFVKFSSEGIATLSLNCPEDAQNFSSEIAKSIILAADSIKIHVENHENGQKIPLEIESSIRKYVVLMQLHKLMDIRFQNQIL